MNLLRPITATAAVLLLGACTGMFKSHVAAPAVYTLRAQALPAAPRAVDAVLVIARPSARSGLDTERMIVTLPDRRLDAYAGSRWSASLPQLIEGLLMDGFRAAAGFKAVVGERSAFGGRYLLQVEIVEFAADYADQGATPVAHVTLRGQLGRVGERRLVADVTGSAAQPASADHQHNVAAAFEAAYAQAAEQLIAAIDAAALADEASGRP